MALEKRWLAVPAQLVTAVGGECGQLEVTNANFFRVKQLVKLDTGSEVLNLQVKRVNSANELELGEPNKDIHDRVNLTSVLPNATLRAPEQLRPTIPSNDTIRATYEEEPVVAQRVILVDKTGNLTDQRESVLITEDGPLPPTGESCPDDGRVAAHVTVQNDAFTKMWDKLTVTQRRSDGQPGEITSFKGGVAQQIMTIQYFDDGEFFDLEVVDAP